MCVLKIKAKCLFNAGGQPENFSCKKEQNRPHSNFYSQEITDSMQIMVNDNLGPSIWHIVRLLGSINWVVREIVKEEIGYKLYIHRKCKFISHPVKLKRMVCMAQMKYARDTNLWPLSYPDLNPIVCFF